MVRILLVPLVGVSVFGDIDRGLFLLRPLWVLIFRRTHVWPLFLFL